MASSPDASPRWWYVGASDAVEGPLDVPTFSKLFEDGLVDGLSKVSNDPLVPLDQWLSLAENSTLRDAVRAVAASDSEEENDVLLRAPQHGEDAQLSWPVETEGTFKPSSAGQLEGQGNPATLNGNDPDGDLALARERKRQSRKRAREAKRLRSQVNTSVYVTGVPLDAGEEELAAHFAKCGILQPNPDTGRPRIKIYAGENGCPKGDVLITYAMAPSVDNALMILDGAPLRAGGGPLHVAKASFSHKKDGNDPSNDSRVREGDGAAESDKRRRKGLRSKAIVEEALSWADEGKQGSNSQRMVVLKNVFDAGNADYEIVRADMDEGCGACGVVEKITVFERSAEGVVAVKFSTLEACVKCIEVMNGRWYDGRRLTAEFYDGVTDFRYRETAEDRLERERKWNEWLENGGDRTEGDKEQQRGA